MKIWKVYANCCIAANPIKETDENAIATAIEENFNHCIENESITFDESNYEEIHSEFVSNLESNFRKAGVLQAGDYQIVLSNCQPQRPDSCGWELIL